MSNRLLLSFVVLMAATLSSSAHATRARLNSLGQNTNGSLYIEDQRSMFQNPAYLASASSSANFELGSATVGATPQAEGGVTSSRGDMKFGLQLGAAGLMQGLITTVNTGAGITGAGARPFPKNTFQGLIAGGTSAQK